MKSPRKKKAVKPVTPGERPSGATEAPVEMSRDEIARRAYDLYLERGCEHGHELEDWLRAERQLQQESGNHASS